jgi:cell fate (sporulation/competence/biofilm development) regulator YlbF (YheA/YmcA/DUF963 family)
MDIDMEEILAQAEELGRLIQHTEIYMNFIRASELLHSDGEAVRILNDYTGFSKEIKERQDRGGIVEKFEIDHAKSLAGMVSEHQAIMEYLNAQKDYLELLHRIQREISDFE